MITKSSSFICTMLLTFWAFGQQSDFTRNDRGQLWQDRSTPEIQSFSSEQYGGAIQNFAFTQDQQGIMYVANAGGVLEYDGKNWRKISVPNLTIFSLACSKEGVIYVGSMEDIGFLWPDSPGHLQFHSLLDKLQEEDRNLKQVWGTFATDDGIFPRQGVLCANGLRWSPNASDRPDCVVFGPSGQYGIWGTNPWFFKVFTGDALTRFGEAHAALYKAEMAEEAFQEVKYEKLLKRPTQCSHVIAICMQRGNNPKIPVIEEVNAVACAVQNMYLTTTALGLAGYWSSGGMSYHLGMKQILGLGEEDQCLGFFMLGRPKDKAYWPKGYRKAKWEEKVEWEGE